MHKEIAEDRPRSRQIDETSAVSAILNSIIIFKGTEKPTSETVILFEGTVMPKPETFNMFKGTEMPKPNMFIIFRREEMRTAEPSFSKKRRRPKPQAFIIFDGAETDRPSGLLGETIN